jgi:hypothetical protein
VAAQTWAIPGVCSEIGVGLFASRSDIVCFANCLQVAVSGPRARGVGRQDSSKPACDECR